MKLKELAGMIGGTVSGNPDVDITGVSGIEEAQQGDITYILNLDTVEDITSLKASALILKEEVKGLTASMVISDNPQYTFARALEVFYVKPCPPGGISEKAVIGSDVVTGNDITVHPHAYIGNGAKIGSNVTISPGAYIGDGAVIGDGSFIHPHVTIREKVTLGKNVIIHAGSVIGADGFGYVLEQGKHYKIPQVGSVIIEDDVEIGANAVIDRGTMGDTVIGRGTKIDNLVQIAHNVKIGKNCIIISQVGISGSVEIGDGVVLAGQVGVRDHIKIGKGAMVGAQSGIGGNIPEGQVYSGSPAIPHVSWLRAQSIYAKLPDFIKRLQKLEKKLQKEEQ